MPDLPTGTVTFLFTDIERSTRLLQQLGDRYADLLAEYRRLLRAAVQERGGQESDALGDAFFAVFPRARDALAAAMAAQRAIHTHQWPARATLRARMGLHTGEVRTVDIGYIGIDLHRAARLGAAGHGGQILLSDTTHALVAEDLPEGVSLRDLGEHRLKDLAHPMRLFQVVAADFPADFPPLKSLDRLPNNLPIQLTSFVGRMQEIAEVKGLLSKTRLLTLTGGGGSGKTRLGLQVAADLLEQYPDGVWLVELASLSDPALVPQTVASTLGVPEQPGQLLRETLVAHLRSKSLLLLLDNCEHLLAACRGLAGALLRACPKLQILATSRETLGVDGELTYPVPSLRLPDLRRPAPFARLAEYEALSLFAERAIFAQPKFILTESNAPVVAQICHRLDGIPLAIEFAAARVRVLSVEQIATRLDDRFRLLTAGSRKALPRQQTLRAMMDWSYDLLSEQERNLLRRLSVFAGGWTLEAAEAVGGFDGLQPADILDLLTRLVDKSLVIVETQGGEARYRFLETVRQYGRERLLESEEAPHLRKRHRDWYLWLAERADPELRGPEQRAWLERLETEHDNLRAALEYCWSTEGGADPGIRLAGALHWFWYLRGYWSEGRGWLEGALTRSGEVNVSILPSALHGAALLMRRQGDYERADPLCERGLTLCRELGDKRYSAWFLLHFGAEALHRKDFDKAEALFQDMLVLCRALADKWFISVALIHLGEVALRQDTYDRALELFTDSLALMREVGDKAITAYVLRYLGELALHRGDHRQAGAFYGEGLALACEVGSKRETEECLEGLAQLASVKGDHVRAVRLFGIAEALRELVGHRYEPHEQRAHAQGVAVTRTALGEETFATDWAAGRAMTLEQAVEYALASA